MSFGWPAAAIVLAYLSGSIPSAYLAGRWVKGVDLRAIGSGNLGTTNVYRELGVGPALIVLAVDMLKGFAPVYLLPGLIAARSGMPVDPLRWWGIGCAVAAVLGHAKPVFLLWRGGGKGVATAAGAFLALSAVPTAICVVVFVVIVAGTRFVSLASLFASAILPVLEWFMVGPSPVFYASLAIALFVAWGHRSNIGRLRAGTEPRFRPPGGATA